MANIITSCRILCSVILLFFPAFSPAFYVLYCLAGFTDMIDGTVARKTDTVSEFGSRLDTIADIVFVAVCLIKLLPTLKISVWMWIWIGAIAVIKAINVILGYIVQKKFVAEHTIINKITGAILFIFPLTLSFIDLNYSGSAICFIATVAAIHEGHLIRTNKHMLQNQ
ncbi:MAG: CDP-alcohol phosphatidyltransferase family protein [Oscillospiraceae bacterium]